MGARKAFQLASAGIYAALHLGETHQQPGADLPVDGRRRAVGPAYLVATSIVGMTDTRQNDQQVPDDQATDAETNAAAVAQGTHREQPDLLRILPILLGVFICGLNIFVTVRLWQSVYQSDFARLNRINLPTTVFLSLISISFFIGLFLIVYSIALRRGERRAQPTQTQPGSIPGQEPVRVQAYVTWILVPALAAVPAAALTVWAAQMIEPIAPTPCVELYEKAMNISKDAPGFRMAWNDRDQTRCSINSVLKN